MPAASSNRTAAVSHLTLLAADAPRSVAERMADIFVARDEDGMSTDADDLHREGFTVAEIIDNKVIAAQIAKERQAKSKTRDVNAAREKSVEEIGRDMADVIGGLFPPVQVVVAELQARGFSQRHIDLLLKKSQAMAALAFCEGQTGWAN